MKEALIDKTFSVKFTDVSEPMINKRFPDNLKTKVLGGFSFEVLYTTGYCVSKEKSK